MTFFITSYYGIGLASWFGTLSRLVHIDVDQLQTQSRMDILRTSYGIRGIWQALVLNQTKNTNKGCTSYY